MLTCVVPAACWNTASVTLRGLHSQEQLLGVTSILGVPCLHVVSSCFAALTCPSTCAVALVSDEGKRGEPGTEEGD